MMLGGPDVSTATPDGVCPDFAPFLEDPTTLPKLHVATSTGAQTDHKVLQRLLTPTAN